MEALGFFLCICALALVLRLIAGSLDGDRIVDCVRGRGGRVVKCRWSPFGTGWLGERGARIYELEYEDRDSRSHRATVRTSLLSGVCFLGDRVVRRPEDRTTNAPEPTREVELQTLREENARLTAELAKHAAEPRPGGS